MKRSVPNRFKTSVKTCSIRCFAMKTTSIVSTVMPKVRELQVFINFIIKEKVKGFLNDKVDHYPPALFIRSTQRPNFLTWGWDFIILLSNSCLLIWHWTHQRHYWQLFKSITPVQFIFCNRELGFLYVITLISEQKIILLFWKNVFFFWNFYLVSLLFYIYSFEREAYFANENCFQMMGINSISIYMFVA